MAVGQYVTLAGLKSRLGIADTGSDVVLQSLVDAANDWIERYLGRAVAPLTDTTISLDGSLAADDGRRLLCPFGIRSLATVEVATQTGGAYAVVPSTDYYLRPATWNRQAGAPATEIVLSEQSGHRFWPGLDTVRLTGQFGWAAVPADLAEVATTLAVRLWHARQTGQADLVGTDETGAPLVSRHLSRRDYETLNSYRLWTIG